MSGSAGQMGAAPTPAAATPLEPTLFPDIDPVLLVKTHGGGTNQSIDQMQAAALAQGQETAAAGAELQASQQEPVAGSPEALAAAP